jgi:predicted DNA-binding protein (UPF0251 family)
MSKRFKIVAVLLAVVMLSTTVMGSVALAQGPTPGPTPETTPPPQGVLQEAFWNILAGKLGISVETLQGYIVDAAREAIAQGVQKGVLTQEQADRLNKILDNQGAHALFIFGPLARQQRVRAFFQTRGIALDTAAATLGMTREDLIKELQAGKSLGQIADEHNVSRDTLKAAIIKALKDAVDKAVQEGRITQQQADTIKARIDAQGIDLDKKFGPRWGQGAPPKVPSSS